MRFRPPWPLLAVYAAVVAGLLLVSGPLSRVYFASPLVGPPWPDPAVPVFQDDLPGNAGPGAPRPGFTAALAEAARDDLRRLLRSWVLAPDALKGLLRAALPGLSVTDPPRGGLAVQGVSLSQMLRRAFETAADVQLGRPWTLLAAELPAMRVIELPEAEGPLVVDVMALLPEWQYEELLAAGRGNVPPTETADDPAAPGQGAGGPQGDDQPEVLVYHTHTTEAFLGPVAAQAGVNPNVVGFTPDPDSNIVRVGAELARGLQQHGVSVLHVTEDFDYVDGMVTRGGAYVRSLRMLTRFQGERSVVEAYPSLRLLVDVHRDAVARDLVTARIDGRTVARVLILIGARDNPRWRGNLCLAERLTALMDERYPGLSRGIQARYDARFNQHLPRSALLLEIGSVENTLEEAVLAAQLLADVLAEAFARGLIPEGEALPACP